MKRVSNTFSSQGQAILYLLIDEQLFGRSTRKKQKKNDHLSILWTTRNSPTTEG